MSTGKLIALASGAIAAGGLAFVAGERIARAATGSGAKGCSPNNPPPKASSPSVAAQIVALAPVLRGAWTELVGGEMPPAALEIAFAQAWLESGVGTWWKDKTGEGQGAGDMRGSNNLGARQCGLRDSGGADYTCVEYGDSAPNADGTQSYFPAKFRYYNSPQAGAKDFLYSIVRQWPAVEELKAGDVLGYAIRQGPKYRSGDPPGQAVFGRPYKGGNGYYGGFGATMQDRVGGYGRAIVARLPAVAAALGHPKVYSCIAPELLTAGKSHIAATAGVESEPTRNPYCQCFTCDMQTPHVHAFCPDPEGEHAAESGTNVEGVKTVAAVAAGGAAILAAGAVVFKNMGDNFLAPERERVSLLESAKDLLTGSETRRDKRIAVKAASQQKANEEWAEYLRRRGKRDVEGAPASDLDPCDDSAGQPWRSWETDEDRRQRAARVAANCGKGDACPDNLRSACFYCGAKAGYAKCCNRQCSICKRPWFGAKAADVSGIIGTSVLVGIVTALVTAAAGKVIEDRIADRSELAKAKKVIGSIRGAGFDLLPPKAKPSEGWVETTANDSGLLAALSFLGGQRDEVLQELVSAGYGFQKRKSAMTTKHVSGCGCDAPHGFDPGVLALPPDVSDVDAALLIGNDYPLEGSVAVTVGVGIVGAIAAALVGSVVTGAIKERSEREAANVVEKLRAVGIDYVDPGASPKKGWIRVNSNDPRLLDALKFLGPQREKVIQDLVAKGFGFQARVRIRFKKSDLRKGTPTIEQDRAPGPTMTSDLTTRLQNEAAFRKGERAPAAAPHSPPALDEDRGSIAALTPAPEQSELAFEPASAQEAASTSFQGPPDIEGAFGTTFGLITGGFTAILTTIIGTLAITAALAVGLAVLVAKALKAAGFELVRPGSQPSEGFSVVPTTDPRLLSALAFMDENRDKFIAGLYERGWRIAMAEPVSAEVNIQGHAPMIAAVAAGTVLLAAGGLYVKRELVNLNESRIEQKLSQQGIYLVAPGKDENEAAEKVNAGKFEWVETNDPAVVKAYDEFAREVAGPGDSPLIRTMMVGYSKDGRMALSRMLGKGYRLMRKVDRPVVSGEGDVTTEAAAASDAYAVAQVSGGFGCGKRPNRHGYPLGLDGEAAFRDALKAWEDCTGAAPGRGSASPIVHSHAAHPSAARAVPRRRFGEGEVDATEESAGSPQVEGAGTVAAVVGGGLIAGALAAIALTRTASAAVPVTMPPPPPPPPPPPGPPPVAPAPAPARASAKVTATTNLQRLKDELAVMLADPSKVDPGTLQAKLAEVAAAEKQAASVSGVSATTASLIAFASGAIVGSGATTIVGKLSAQQRDVPTIAPEPPPPVAPPPAPPSRTYTVKPDDSPFRIALAFNATKRDWWKELSTANPQKKTRGIPKGWEQLLPGEVVIIPREWPEKMATVEGSLLGAAWTVLGAKEPDDIDKALASGSDVADMATGVLQAFQSGKRLVDRNMVKEDPKCRATVRAWLEKHSIIARFWGSELRALAPLAGVSEDDRESFADGYVDELFRQRELSGSATESCEPSPEEDRAVLGAMMADVGLSKDEEQNVYTAASRSAGTLLDLYAPGAGQGATQAADSFAKLFTGKDWSGKKPSGKKPRKGKDSACKSDLREAQAALQAEKGLRQEWVSRHSILAALTSPDLRRLSGL